MEVRTNTKNQNTKSKHKELKHGAKNTWSPNTWCPDPFIHGVNDTYETEAKYGKVVLNFTQGECDFLLSIFFLDFEILHLSLNRPSYQNHRLYELCILYEAREDNKRKTGELCGRRKFLHIEGCRGTQHPGVEILFGE
jgi:hypothetical protein